MRRGEGALLVALLALGTVVLPATTAAAQECLCELPPVTKEMGDELVAKDVFTGRVTATRPIREGVRLIDVEVDRVFQGQISGTVSVEAETKVPPCGFDPAVGSDVLMFTVTGSADRGRNQSEATTILPCYGGRDAKDAAVLGAGRAPPGTGSSELSSVQVGAAILLSAGALAAVGVIVGVLVTGRRARRRTAT